MENKYWNGGNTTTGHWSNENTRLVLATIIVQTLCDQNITNTKDNNKNGMLKQPDEPL